MTMGPVPLSSGRFLHPRGSRGPPESAVLAPQADSAAARERRAGPALEQREQSRELRHAHSQRHPRWRMARLVLAYKNLKSMIRASISRKFLSLAARSARECRSSSTSTRFIRGSTGQSLNRSCEGRSSALSCSGDAACSPSQRRKVLLLKHHRHAVVQRAQRVVGRRWSRSPPSASTRPCSCRASSPRCPPAASGLPSTLAMAYGCFCLGPSFCHS